MYVYMYECVYRCNCVSDYRVFFQDRETLSAILTQEEDWLYSNGEDQTETFAGEGNILDCFSWVFLFLLRMFLNIPDVWTTNYLSLPRCVGTSYIFPGDGPSYAMLPKVVNVFRTSEEK